MKRWESNGEAKDWHLKMRETASKRSDISSEKSAFFQLISAKFCRSVSRKLVGLQQLGASLRCRCQRFDAIQGALFVINHQSRCIQAYLSLISLERDASHHQDLSPFFWGGRKIPPPIPCTFFNCGFNLGD